MSQDSFFFYFTLALAVDICGWGLLCAPALVVSGDCDNNGIITVSSLCTATSSVIVWLVEKVTQGSCYVHLFKVVVFSYNLIPVGKKYTHKTLLKSLAPWTKDDSIYIMGLYWKSSTGA